MEDEIKLVEDLSWEHEQHTSDDWETLESRCSECHKALEEVRLWLKNYFPAAQKLQELRGGQSILETLSKVELNRRWSNNPFNY